MNPFLGNKAKEPRGRELVRALEEKVLPFIRRPGRYIGAEDQFRPAREGEVSLLLSYPDLYEVGMSNHALKLLYENVNALDFARAERAFAFWDDMARATREAGIPLYSLENFLPAGGFDFWGFSLSAELTYSNILGMLAAAALPLRARERSWPGSPLVLGGGPGAYNPEPLADFFDLFLIGDAEEALVELLRAYRDLRSSLPDKESLLRALAARVAGLYAPALYRPVYSPAGAWERLEPLFPEAPAHVPKRVLADLSRSRLLRPLSPLAETVHDRGVVEVMRGCRRGCRFCQAGWTGRPVREKAPAAAADEVRLQTLHAGCDEVSLLSLSSGDYGGLFPVMADLKEFLDPGRINLSLPSLNAASVGEGLFAELSRVRRAGLTLAPEAASERLQKVINKPSEPGTVERLLQAARLSGWRLAKLYYLIGLPSERDEDIEDMGRQIGYFAASGGRLNVTISNFVPKPQTPLQWEEQVAPGEIERRQGILRRCLRARNVRLKFRDPWMSLVEGALARGDRRTGSLLEAAYRRGAGFDDWRERFRREVWEGAWGETGLLPASAAAGRGEPGMPLPWDHIGGGVPRAVLVREAILAREAAG